MIDRNYLKLVVLLLYLTTIVKLLHILRSHDLVLEFQLAGSKNFCIEGKAVRLASKTS